MQTSQGNLLDSLKAVQHCLDEHATKLGDVATGAARKRLDDVIAELAAHVADESGSDLAAQGNTKKQRALRIDLIRDHMAHTASGPLVTLAKHGKIPRCSEKRSRQAWVHGLSTLRPHIQNSQRRVAIT